MDLDQKFVKLYEGWKKGKYKITDDKGNIIGTYNSGSKAQKVVDDLMQQGKYDKLTVEIIEDLEKEASTYRDKQKKSKDKKQFGISRKKGNIRHGGSGYGEDVDENYDKLISEDVKSVIDAYVDGLNYYSHLHQQKMVLKKNVNHYL